MVRKNMQANNGYVVIILLYVEFEAPDWRIEFKEHTCIQAASLLEDLLHEH